MGPRNYAGGVLGSHDSTSDQRALESLYRIHVLLACHATHKAQLYVPGDSHVIFWGFVVVSGSGSWYIAEKSNHIGVSR